MARYTFQVFSIKLITMYQIILRPLEPHQDYRFVLMKNGNESFININISPVDGNFLLTILESNDGGFFFTDVTERYSNFNIDTHQNLDDACIHITQYFIEKGYKIIDYKT